MLKACTKNNSKKGTFRKLMDLITKGPWSLDFQSLPLVTPKQTDLHEGLVIATVMEAP